MNLFGQPFPLAGNKLHRAQMPSLDRGGGVLKGGDGGVQAAVPGSQVSGPPHHEGCLSRAAIKGGFRGDAA